jgi:DNA-binding transcriptional regulator GbsR (MarR family)
MRSEALGQQVKTYIEQFGIQLEALGLPRMAGRVIGWLLVCSPSHQNARDLEIAVGGSKASISTTLQMLVRLGIVERLGIPGVRSAFYQIRTGSWTNYLEKKAMEVRSMRELAERGLAILAGEPPERRLRLEEVRDMYGFFEQEWPALVQRYYRSRAAITHATKKRRRR